MKYLIAALLAIWPVSVSADTINWTHLPGQGYRITHESTHPGMVAGAELVFEAQAQYVYEDEDGEEQIAVVDADPLVLTIAEAVWRKEWTYTIPPGISAVVDHDSGLGGVELLGDMQIKVWQSFPNDGQAHTFSWRLMLRP